MADQVSLRVCYITDLRRISIRTSTDSTVAEFKALVALRFDVPVDRQRLFHNNRELRDDQTIQSYGIIFIFKLSSDYTIFCFTFFVDFVECLLVYLC